MKLFGFNSKKGEVLNHWIAFVDSFNYPPQEFYASFEKALEAHRIPNLEISRVEFSEGGLFSEKRIYVRMIRELLAFDMCAAPFGPRFFFSCRRVYPPAILEWWHILVLFFAFG